MILPNWPAPANVLACSTTRLGLPNDRGASTGGFAHFNLGDHVGDTPSAVAANRQRLLQHLAPAGVNAIQWLQQVHGTEVFSATGLAVTPPPAADAAITERAGLALAVMTADCLPVLFCDRDGRQVAAAHAGWRGLCSGVLLTTLARFSCPPENLMVWLGPAISVAHFEVGAEVRDAFLKDFSGPARSELAACFRQQPECETQYCADLYQLARLQLKSQGIEAIYGGEHCTFAEEGLFYSYRRESHCGRQASIIALL